MRPHSVNRQDKITADTGKQADITILDAKNIDYPLYFRPTWPIRFTRLENWS